MPRIPDELVDCIVYLYPTIEEAKRGATRQEPGFGGTGFLISLPLEDDPQVSVNYVVTNSHVVGSPGESRVLRVNAVGGGSEIGPTNQEDWIHHPDGDDVAVAMIGLSPQHFNVRTLAWSSWAATTAQLDQWRVGPGDDVIFIGRFRWQEGRGRNLPTTRTGTIARMPLGEGVSHPRGFNQESFLIEARSISGYSGSPVFLFIPPFSWRGELANQNLDSRFHLSLIGIDWGYLPDHVPVIEKDLETPVPENTWVAQNSGIMMVVPVWRIDQFLKEDERLKTQRRDTYTRWKAEQGQPAALNVAQPNTESEPTREGFFRDLRKIKKEPRARQGAESAQRD